MTSLPRRQTVSLTIVAVLVLVFLFGGWFAQVEETATKSEAKDIPKESSKDSSTDSPTDSPKDRSNGTATTTTADNSNSHQVGLDLDLNDKDLDEIVSQFLTCPSSALEQLPFAIQGNNCQQEQSYRESFAPTLWRYVLQNHVPNWATKRRPRQQQQQYQSEPFLLTLDRNQTWLFLGTLQQHNVAKTLACHIWQSAPSQWTIHVNKDPKLDRWTQQYVLTHQPTQISLTMWVISDTYAVYSRNHWDVLLRWQMQDSIQSLQDLDLIVAGTFHTCSSTDATHFTAKLQSAMIPIKPRVDNDLDCFSIPPPDMSAWRSKYTGPLFFLTSSFVDVQAQGPLLYEDVRQYQQQQSPQSSNSSLVGMLPLSYHYDHLVWLYSPEAARHGGTGLYPCIGQYGSYWDLFAWEIEDFWRYASGKNIDTASASDTQPTFRHWQLAPPTVDATGGNTGKLATHNTFHYCTGTSIHVDGHPFSPPVPISYRCRGPLYDAFSRLLRQYATAQDDASWGKRAWPVPDHTRILVFGNSHTRQMVEALVCMYSPLLEEIRSPTPHSWWYHFANNASLAVIVNTPIPFSSKWRERLHEELELEVPLHEAFDAMVLGMTNLCQGTSNYVKSMQDFSRKMPDVDCLRHTPPTLVNWTQVFSKQPIVFLPMMTHHDMHDTLYQEVQKLQATHNVSLVPSRQHIDAVGVECTSFNRTTWSDCLENHATHRCQGSQGSHADLIAWSVVERLYQVLT